MNKIITPLKHFVNNFIEDESGLTAVEYAIAGGLVVGGMVAAFVALGDNATDQITKLSCSAGGGTWTDGTAGTPTTPATPGTCS